MNDIVKVNEEKINALTLIDNKRKEVMQAHNKYLVIPYMPITKDFIQGIILNDTEYPIFESKLSQAATEMKTRFNSIVDSEYTYQKTMIEIEKLELDIEDIMTDEKLSDKRRAVMIREKQLEIDMKNYQISSIRTNTDYLYNEYENWCHTVQEYVDIIKQLQPDVKSFEDINFNGIRINEIHIKIQRWAAMEDAGVQLTPSQKNLVDSYRLAVAEQKRREETNKHGTGSKPQ